jgi:pyruvate dehydrogenase E1 component alpha subunit
MNSFYKALKIRRVEEEIVKLYPSDKIQSPVHLSIGQEHHIAVLCEMLSNEDKVFSSYRSHALYVGLDCPLDLMFAELFGKSTGVSGGKAGSMHLCYPANGFMGSSAIVGAIFSHALGLAYAKKIQSQNGVVLTVSGDGSTEEGTFFETLNMSRLLEVPILFVIEDNGLAIKTNLQDRRAFQLDKICESFQIPYFEIKSGHDFSECETVSARALKRVREAKTPVLLNVKTYRYFEHVGISPMKTPEVLEAQKTDPLCIWTEKIKEHESRIQQEIKTAVDFAERSSFPNKSDLLKDVY